MKEKKLKVYIAPDIDGTNTLIVATETQAAACKKFGVSADYWKRYGGHVLNGDYEICPIAMAMPGLVWSSNRDKASFTPQRGQPLPEKPPVKVRWTIETGLCGCDHTDTWEFNWYEWHGMTDNQRTAMLDEMLQDEIGNYINAGYTVIGGAS
jgi:hypothetical protein